MSYIFEFQIFRHIEKIWNENNMPHCTRITCDNLFIVNIIFFVYVLFFCFERLSYVTVRTTVYLIPTFFFKLSLTRPLKIKRGHISTPKIWKYGIYAPVLSQSDCSYFFVLTLISNSLSCFPHFQIPNFYVKSISSSHLQAKK